MKKIDILMMFLAVSCGGTSLIGDENEKSLAWLGYLRLPKPILEAKKTVRPTPPLSWKAWTLDEGGEIKWIPRYKGYVNIVGKSLKVLPKGPDPTTLTRRQRHQEGP
jgi:hypothetical protein